MSRPFPLSIPRQILFIALLFNAGCASYLPPHHNETIHRKILFASPQGHNLYMDLFVPRTPSPAPVVIWIFGGSWKIGSNGYHINIRDLTRYGIAVASIQYRLSGTAKYPAQLNDCRSAMNWLRDNGRRYGIDGTRIGASGESAGGHLAALLGLVEGKTRIRAVCSLYPPTDLVSLGRKYEKPGQSSDIEKLIGGPLEQNLASAADASPVNHVTPTSPPFLLIHGDQDKLVPLAQSQELQKKLSGAGIESQLIVVRGKGHWFFLEKSQLAKVAGFFQKHFRLPYK